MRKLGFMLTAAALIIALAAPTAHGGGAPSFADLEGHWAAPLIQQAVAAGYIDGYSDGTFRPDAPITRAELTKLLVVAGQIEPNPDRSPSFSDLEASPAHWVVSQGYLNTAAAISIFPNREGAFRPDEPASRMDTLAWVLGLLGRNRPLDPSEPIGPLPFTDEIPVAERFWAKTGLDLGLIAGYPDGTFRPDGPVTRAEAVAVVQRALSRMEAGTDPSLTLVVEGKPVPGAILSVRDGIVYAPARAVYATAKGSQGWQSPLYYSLHVANERYVLSGETLGIGVYLPEAAIGSHRFILSGGKWSDAVMDGRLDLLATPYVRFGQLMLAVAPIGGEGTIPYGKARHDVATGTVTITYAADWPGYLLPATPAGLEVRPLRPRVMSKARPRPTQLRTPDLVDPQGLFLTDWKTPFVFTVSPDAPLRFKDSATTVTCNPWNDGECAVLTLLPDALTGTYIVRISGDGYAPINQEIAVVK